MHNHENISATDKAVINFIKASKDYITIPKIKQLCKNLKVNDHGRYEISSDNISMYILAHKQIYQTIKIFNNEYILKFDNFNTVKYFFKQFNWDDYVLNELIRTKNKYSFNYDEATIEQDGYTYNTFISSKDGFNDYTIMVLDNKTRIYVCSIIHDNSMPDIKVHIEYFAAQRFAMKHYTDIVDINFLPCNIRKQIDAYITLLSLKG